ncbi:hypothetical protein [Gorillibacterium sp. CAU 1737]|uniref:hypothetical protein n=1 Tax=Gorillibacterium sp. CAU 1737 TaxID=3140362 RepID=UPI0032600BE0
MLNAKGKRKLEFRGSHYYWYIKLHDGTPKIHILSEDKKVQLCYGFDKELSIAKSYVIDLLSQHLDQTNTK